MADNTIMYQNLLTGKYTIDKKINSWLNGFLDSFTESEYHAQDSILRPYEYKALMKLAESNCWNMLTCKQWDIFRKYVDFKNGTYEEFANFEHNKRKFNIRISNKTGFVTIMISK